jgi:hypothetical protein
VDLDYYFGKFFGNDGNTLGFLDWAMDADIDDNGQADALERMRVRLAFLNDGAGRAEANAQGGDLDAKVANFVECWDTTVQSTYLYATITEGDTTTPFVNEGSLGNCGLIFSHTLAELEIPTIEQLDPNTLSAMECVAENGPSGCEG